MSGISVLLCFAALAAPVSVDVAKPPARNISEYNLFKDPARQIPNDGVLPYYLNTPLYSDYASKHRFIWLPEGARAEYRDRDDRGARRYGDDDDDYRHGKKRKRESFLSDLFDF